VATLGGDLQCGVAMQLQQCGGHVLPHLVWPPEALLSSAVKCGEENQI